jgi:predicted TIM-barrel fold metal-dependent hydrolase
MKIIDAHTHPIFSTPWESSEQLAIFNLSDAEIRRRAREAGIEQMVVLGNILKFGPGPTAEQMRDINEETERLVSAGGGFYIGLCYLNPLLPAEVLEAELNRFVANGPCVGIKLEVDCCASDERMNPMMELAEGFDIPVLQHAWDTKNRPRLHMSPDKAEIDGADVAMLARRFPRVRIQMAHLTGVGRSGVDAVRDCPNVWVDTSGALPVAGMTEYAVRELGEERVIYGSDFPIRDLHGSLAKVHGAAIPRRAREMIFAENWERMMATSLKGC